MRLQFPQCAVRPIDRNLLHIPHLELTFRGILQHTIQASTPGEHFPGGEGGGMVQYSVLKNNRLLLPVLSSLCIVMCYV